MEAPVIDLSPVSPAEEAEQAAITQKLREVLSGMRVQRRSLTLQELYDMPDAHPVLYLHVPGTDLHVFTISGTLGAKKVTGALLAGEFAIVRGRTRADAYRLAESGLADTIRHAVRYAELEHFGIDPMSDLPSGLEVEVGGRKVITPS